MITKILIIRGRVQGVGYRESLRVEAELHDVTGWVRNRIDGSVEAMVQGSAEAVQCVIQWAHQGPRAARVMEVEVAEGSGVFARFEVYPTC
jgi:acylphosphatase